MSLLSGEAPDKNHLLFFINRVNHGIGVSPNSGIQPNLSVDAFVSCPSDSELVPLALLEQCSDDPAILMLAQTKSIYADQSCSTPMTLPELLSASVLNYLHAFSALADICLVRLPQ